MLSDLLTGTTDSYVANDQGEPFSRSGVQQSYPQTTLHEPRTLHDLFMKTTDASKLSLWFMPVVSQMTTVEYGDTPSRRQGTIL